MPRRSEAEQEKIAANRVLRREQADAKKLRMAEAAAAWKVQRVGVARAKLEAGTAAAKHAAAVAMGARPTGQEASSAVISLSSLISSRCRQRPPAETQPGAYAAAAASA